MKKARKVLAVVLAFVLTVSLSVAGTIAYLTDTDKKTNVFTTGNVEIELKENFGDNDPDTPEKLLPATGSAQEGTLKNGVTKEVSVKNIGSEDAYVRVHIAIPTLLDDGDPNFDASANVLHFNYDPDSIGEGKWDWSKTTGAAYEGNWNCYKDEINGKEYNVYVVTYGSVLKYGDETPEKAMHQVYLDSKVTNEDLTRILSALEEIDILVVAEGAQAAGFTDAYAALNTAFGVPGEYDVDWTNLAIA